MNRKSLWNAFLTAISHQTESQRKTGFSRFREKGGERHQGKMLRLEALEDRQLLSVNPGEMLPGDLSLAAINAQNSAFSDIAAQSSLTSKGLSSGDNIDWTANSLSDKIDVLPLTSGNTITVTSLGDDENDKTTLRGAIESAGVGDTITFADSLKGKTITLSGQALDINKSITIDASSLLGENNEPGITIAQLIRVASFGCVLSRIISLQKLP
ncbi:MAG: hypothetical protein Q4C95_12510 [Planctomycetia bacterium]|nr:hypothetical protein [Planctomycetia bacterium]